MLYGKYDFICRFEKEAVLPEYKGSTFHGVFGRALKNVVCALKRQSCNNCPLQQRCLYVHVFETSLVRHSEKAAKLPDIPHPYIIEPSQIRQNIFEKDSTLSCSLVLFGRFNRDLPYFIYAFALMGKTGLGRRISNSRGKFRLVNVLSDKESVYSEETGIIDVKGCTRNLTIKQGNDTKALNVELNLITPLRVKHKQRIVRELPFHVLVRAMLRRVSALMEVYGDGEPHLDFRGLVEKAETVKTGRASLEWYDWERYSFRQKRRMPMGGLVGTISYENVPGDFLPLIDFCEKVHIGKNTSFGLGEFKSTPSVVSKQTIF